MAQDTASTRIKDSVGGLLSLRWSGRISVTRRILAVNSFALVVLAASFVYLDSYRARLIDRWRLESLTQAELVAAALTREPNANQASLAQLAQIAAARIRVVGDDGRLVRDAWPSAAHAYGYSDPARDPWTLKTARVLDRGIDAIVRAPALPDFDDALPLTPKTPHTALAYAPDRTPMISAVVPLPHGYVLTTENARTITETVRDERLRLALIILGVSLFSVLLSLFLARTIVQPLRRLAMAAVRVRLGRARDVTVPRLPNRSDEIGMLARALSDMTMALRARIDATEAFAADVAHELKNPLASLGSAVDSLSVVQATELKAQLIGIIRHDVRRLDRLISDIAHLSRLDAQMTRTPFTRIDLGALVDRYLAQHDARTPDKAVPITRVPALGAPAIVMGDAGQLERAFGNLIDNALSFAPPDTRVRVGTFRRGALCQLWVEDDGPGVPEAEREAIFRRFHSGRDTTQGSGDHSGLGLAITRTIIEAHNGSVSVLGHADDRPGARFVIVLPAADAP